MGFGIGYINMQVLYQKFLRFDMPFVYSSEQAALIPNPKLKSRIKRMPLWTILNIIMVFIWVFGVIHISQLLKHAEKVSKVDPEELIAYWFLFAIVTQQLISAYTFERDPVAVTRMVSQAFQLCGIKDVGLPTPERPPEFSEIFCYIVAGGFLSFPSITTFLPFIRSYDPLTILAKYIIPEGTFDIPRKIVTGFSYFFFTFLASTSCCSYILLAMSTTHAFETLTRKLLTMTDSKKYPSGEDDKSALWKRIIMKIAENVVYILQPLIIRINTATGVTTSSFNDSKGNKAQPQSFILYETDFSFPSTFKQNSILYPSRTTNNDSMVVLKDYGPQAVWNDTTLHVQTPKYCSIRKFRQVHAFHSQVRMLITVSNKSVEAFVPVMNGVGMSICMLLSVAIIKIINLLPKLSGTKALYASLAIVVFALLVGIIFGLITFFFKHASEPSLYSSECIKYWQNQPLPSLERRQARAMSVIAFKIGPFGKATKRGALSEMQKISDFTITLLLGLD